MKKFMLYIGVCGLALTWLTTAARGQEMPMDELGWIEKQLSQLSYDPAAEATFGTGGSTEAIFHGFVFLNGRYLAPPYVLQWNGANMTINGVRVPLTSADGISGERWLARCEQRLRNDMLLVSVDGEPVKFVEPAWAVSILQVLLSNETWPAKIETLVKSGCEQFHSGQWTLLVERFRATSEIEERVAALQERLATPHTPAAAGRSTATVLTACSMALAMIGFATIVNFRPGESISAARGCWLVFRCVALLVMFNLFDLFCTMTSFRAGTLWELNPLANPILHKTDSLVAFKASLTILPASILLALRHNRIAQFASWWACLLYTVLIFRWTAFNSLFLN